MLLLKEGANSITLLDKSKQAIKYAKKLSSKLKLKKIKFLSSNSSNLPFQNNQFDIVHSTGLLEHFHDKMILQILKECRRVLKPKGLASMTIPNFFSPEIIWRIIKNKGKGSERHLSKSKMKKLMKLAGFKNVKFINAHASVAPSFFPFQNWFTKFIDNAIKPLDYLNLCYDYK
ncbi:unnamed protein product [marine sediment metagenome]|uniref:Methyltransferase domain-containing protein n=1 Tax=marine sediment metagenome TaxID=412755 RepID=X1LMK5_9ZZZZ